VREDPVPDGQQSEPWYLPVDGRSRPLAAPPEKPQMGDLPGEHHEEERTFDALTEA
jgi:hypothetical protein